MKRTRNLVTYFFDGDSSYPGHGEEVLAYVMSPGDGVGGEPMYSFAEPISAR